MRYVNLEECLLCLTWYNFVLQIWDAVDNKQGYLNRNGLYKALALTALAQQGKNVSDKLLETFSGQGNLFVSIYIFTVMGPYFNHKLCPST